MQNNLLLFFITWKEKYFLELLILNQFGIMNKGAKSYQTCNVAEIRKVWFRRLFLLIWQNRPIAIGFSFKSSFKKIIKSLIMTYWFQGEAIRTYKNPMISFVVIAPHKMKVNLWQMKNMSNPTINDVIIIFLKDDLKEKPIAIGLFGTKKWFDTWIWCKKNCRNDYQKHIVCIRPKKSFASGNMAEKNRVST